MSFVVYRYRGWIMHYWSSGHYNIWRDNYEHERAEWETVRPHFFQVFTLMVGHEPSSGKLKRWEV